MKKNIKLNLKFFFIGLGILFLFSCKKDDEIKKSLSNISSDAIYFNGDAFLSSPCSFELYLSNLDVSEEERNINNVLYHIGKAISIMAQNESIVNIINETLSDSDYVSIHSLLKINDFRDELSSLLAEESLNIDSLIESMIYDGDNYFPVIYFVNKLSSNVDINKKPILASGVTFDDDMVSDTLGSYIFSWIENEEVLISEEMSENISSPLYVISNHTNIYKTEEIAESEEVESPKFSNELTLSNLWKKPFTNSFRIDMRYETSKHSEYAFVSNLHTYEGFHGFSERGYRIKLIHKKDIRKTINELKHFTTLEPSNTIYYLGVVFVTFEKDWYVRGKNVRVITPYGELMASCPMRFNNEYYQIAYLSKNSSKKYIQKGFIVLKDEN